MGMWSVPWETEEKAKVFAEKMSQPWIASVTNVDGTPSVELSEIGGMFWEQKCLVGSDDILDLLSDQASENSEDFDIRKIVKESLKIPLEEMELQLSVPKNVEAINVVRVSVGKEPLTVEFFNKPSQELGRKVLEVIKSHEIGPLRYSISFYPQSMSPLGKKMMGVPEDINGKDCYCLVLEQKEFQFDMSGLTNVKKWSCERPGLYRFHYVL